MMPTLPGSRMPSSSAGPSSSTERRAIQTRTMLKAGLSVIFFSNSYLALEKSLGAL
jgi:hypothetical protein